MTKWKNTKYLNYKWKIVIQIKLEGEGGGERSVTIIYRELTFVLYSVKTDKQ